MTATKRPGFLLEPIQTAPNAEWEGHHATNPCVIRFSSDPRVFLGYRAGGEADAFWNGAHKTWRSHLGLAIMDPAGETITCRLPLPIFTLDPGICLPQTAAEYEQFVAAGYLPNAYVLHDFRFMEYRGYLYMVYHEGPLNDCFDCVVRMPVAEFIARVDRSIEISKLPEPTRTEQWRELWWADDTWENCGVNGTNRIFGSRVFKGDIVYFELADGTLQMCHRPLSVGCAVLPVGEKLHADVTADGLTTYGSFELNARPGFSDNSHIGNDGAPSRACIGGKHVYIDVTHGCWNNVITTGEQVPWDVVYYAYLRIKDAATGELLYYSEDPIIEYGREWNSYAENGRWISELGVHRGIMFAGGQLERIAGKRGLDDEFLTYVGLGDTAIGLASFTLRRLLPRHVIDDIQARDADLDKPVTPLLAAPRSLEGDACGWKWVVRNNGRRRTVEIVRTLPRSGETGVREINSRPGYFDAHGLAITADAMLLDEELEAWVITYQGIRLSGNQAAPRTQVGYGLLMVSSHDPEQVLYRSALPVSVEALPGWRFEGTGREKQLLPLYRELIPAKVLDQIRNIATLRRKGVIGMNQFERWLREKSGLEKPGLWPMPQPKLKMAAPTGAAQ